MNEEFQMPAIQIHNPQTKVEYLSWACSSVLENNPRRPHAKMKEKIYAGELHQHLGRPLNTVEQNQIGIQFVQSSLKGHKGEEAVHFVGLMQIGTPFSEHSFIRQRRGDTTHVVV
jgi:hypothetical protein